MNRKNCTEMMCYSYRVLSEGQNMALGRNPTADATPDATPDAESRAEPA